MSNISSMTFRKPTTEELKTIITDPDGTEIVVRCAQEIGTALARQLTTSQIRALFGEVRRIEGNWRPIPGEVERNEERRRDAYRSLLLLKPKMAYRARKERGRGVEDLVSVLAPAIDLVQGERENFNRFVDFLEAILAYHKAGGGRD